MTAQYIGALDIGGTKIAATIANQQGPLQRVTAPTIKSGSPHALGEQAIALLQTACAQAEIDFQLLHAVGVSACGPFVTRDKMTALATPNICGALSPLSKSNLPNNWDAIPLEQTLRKQFKAVVIKNDCVAGLIAERTFGALQNEPNCVYATWSTGIGFGLCVDGHILHGKHGNAGHAGHVLMDSQSIAGCGCGNTGDLEALISGRALQQRIGINAADFFETSSSEMIATAQWFGRALYNLAVTLDTRAFIIGGSIWLNHAARLTPMVLHEIYSRLPVLTQDVVVLSASLGTWVTDLGALILIMPPEWLASWRNTQAWQMLDP